MKSESRAHSRASISVIIPARNEERSIKACLEGLLSQTLLPNEVIVIDGQSADRTVAIVEDFSRRDPRIRVVPNERRVTPVALNIGLAESSGDYLIRIDAHAVPEPDYIERIVKHLDSGEYAGVGGVKVAAGGNSMMGEVIAGALASRFGVGGSKYHYATVPEEVDHIPFGAYRRSDLEAVGGWNPQLLVNQDFELDYRMRASGRRLLLDPNIRIRWKSSQNLRDLSHQYARYGTGKAAVVGMHPRSVKPRHLLLPILVVVMPVGLLFSVLTRRPWMATILLPYAAFLGAGSADEKLHGGQMRRAAIAPVVLLTMHFSWGFGFWRGVARALMGSNKTAPDPFRDRDLTQGV